MPRWWLVPLALLLACGETPPEETDDTVVDVPSDETNRDGVCSFNRECPADQHCACDETTGCACEDGARGTGEAGVDACVDGDDCASALCIEGPGGDLVCSDECEDAQDCPEHLPQCIDVAFVGRICVREAGR